MRNLISGGIAALALLGGTLAAAAVPASASAAVVRPVGAVTHLSGRPDSGGHGNWDTDTLFRTLTIRSLGGDSYTATATDSGGSFVAGKGDFVPNQTANAGAKFTQAIRGTFHGQASFSFTASKAPNGKLVPRIATGTGPTDTSDWYKLAFPAGTVFGGTGILTHQRRAYSANLVTASPPPGKFSETAQSWNDYATNNGGQGPGTPAAGQIKDFAGQCLDLSGFGF